jgi:hypothetical protein
MSKELRNEVSGVRTEDLVRCVDIMGQLEESFRGNKSFEDAWNDELYRSVYRLEIESLRRNSRHELKKIAYKDVCEMGKLLRALYDRMATYYNYGYADGAELPGVSWSMENNGVFVISLKKCAINMVHSLVGKDENGLAQRGFVFNVWLDVPDMEADEDEEPFCLDRNCCKYVGFTCDFNGEHKDVTFEAADVDDDHLELVRDILADFDMIGELVGDKLKR